MTALPFLLLLLAPCFVLPSILLASLYGGTRSQSAARPTTQEMETVLKGLRADVEQFDVDAREQSWRRENWDGPASNVASRLTESSHEVMALTTYAEASVSLVPEEGRGEQRWCSLCLN